MGMCCRLPSSRSDELRQIFQLAAERVANAINPHEARRETALGRVKQWTAQPNLAVGKANLIGLPYRDKRQNFRGF